MKGRQTKSNFLKKKHLSIYLCNKILGHLRLIRKARLIYNLVKEFIKLVWSYCQKKVSMILIFFLFKEYTILIFSFFDKMILISYNVLILLWYLPFGKKMSFRYPLGKTILVYFHPTSKKKEFIYLITSSMYPIRWK